MVSHLVGLSEVRLAPFSVIIKVLVVSVEILVTEVIPFRCSEEQKDQGNASRSSIDLVGSVDLRLYAEAGIDGSSARLGLFRIFGRTLSDAENAREGHRKRVVELMKS